MTATVSAVLRPKAGSPGRPMPDVFISYSHRDNEPDEVLGGEWVSDLDRALRQRLGKFLGRDVEVWRDPRIKGSEPLDEALDRRLSEALALVCVVTPSYIGSPWCQQELATFVDNCRQQGLERIDGSTRLFKVLTMPVEPDEQPEPVRDLLGYEFFTHDPKTGYPQELHKAFGSEVQVEYWQRLTRLAREVAALLRAMEGASHSTAPEGPSIYLAETSDDLKGAREAVRSDLERKGCRLRPDLAVPNDSEALAPFFEAQMAGCAFSVHFIGRLRGTLVGGSTPVVEAQLEAARRSGLGRILWMPEGLKPVDPAQRELMKGLRNGSLLGPSDDLIEGSLEKLRLAIDRVRASAPASRRTAQPPRAAADFGGRRRRVYLIFDEADADRVEPLSEALFARGCEVLTPAFEGDEKDVRLEDQENLKVCDAVLLYWGGAGELWRRRRLRDVQKSWGYGRTRPLLSTAVYVAAPATPEKERFRSHEILVLSELGEQGRELLGPFFEQLEGGVDAQEQ